MGTTADLSSRVAILTLCFSAAALASTTTLTSSTASAILGKNVTLTAAVSPSTATGKVTFYDGATVLGISTLSEGSATWKTALLNTGPHALTARYDGDANNTQSLSAPVTLLVQSLPASAVQANPPFDSVPYSSALYADFNRDGKVDVVGLDGDSELHVLLGNGAGVFTAAATFPTVATYLLGDFNGDGNTDIAIAENFSPSFTVLLGNGDGTFRNGPVTQIPGVNAVASLGVAADFNGDGTLDLLVADTNSNIVYVLTGNGDGTFHAPAAVAGLFQLPAVAGDFNGDGKLDLFNLAGYFFAGNGDGTFASGTSILPGEDLASLTAVDINSDGKLDIVALNSGTMETLLGNGNGTFQIIPGPTNANDPLLVTDFNGDGKLDAVNYTSVAFGNGDGTFQSFTPIPGMQNALDALLAADLNGSGQADLVAISESGGPTVYLATYYGAISLSASPNPATYGQPFTLTAVVTPATATGSVSFYSGGALLGAAPVVSGVASLSITANASGRQVLTASYSGDSANQPAVSAPITLPVNGASSTVSLAASSVSPTYGQTLTLTATVSPRAATGLVTFYDGALAVGVEPVTNGKAVFSTATLNTGAHSFSAQYDAGASYSISVSNVVAVTVTSAAAGAVTAGTTVIPDLRYSVTTVDLNHDGLSDLIGLDGNGNVAVLLGTGNGGFASPVLYPAGPSPWTLVVADVNDDGNPDVVVGNGFTIAVLFGNGDGTLRTGPTTTFQSTQMGVSSGELLAGDLNGDGKIDLLLLGSNGPAAVLLGNGDGTFVFSAPTNFPTPGNGAVLGDFNGDGKLDCVLVPGGYEALLFLAGNGDGTFQNPVTIQSTSITGPVAAADFNGDGKLDLVVGTLVESYGFGVLLGNGNGTFGPMTIYNAAGFGFFIADFNGDGKPDILVDSYGSSVLFLGNGDGTFTGSPSPIYFYAAAIGSFGTYAAVDVVTQVNNNLQIEFGVRPSTLSLTAAPNPGTLGQPVTITATITPSNATGTVTFYDNDVFIGTAPVAGGVATFVTSSLAANQHSLGAIYGGDIQTASSYFAFLPEFIDGLTSTVTLTTPAGPVTYGQPVKLNVTVSPSSATGEVTFLEGTKILGSTVLSSGAASLNTPLLDSGLDSLRAVYTGNSVYTAGSTSAAVSLQVNAVPGGAFIPNAAPLPAFAPATNVASAVGDLNHDGIPDVVVTTGSQVCAYLGNGDGTFRQGWCGDLTNYDQSYPAFAVIADFNGDGIPDLVISNTSYGNPSPSLFSGNGDGTFTEDPALNLFGVYYAQAMAAADMNLDGIPDVVIYGTQILVDLGNGNNTFGPGYGPVVTLPERAASLVVADFNADGKPDVAIAGNDPANVTMFLGNGDGSLQSPINFAAGDTPTLMVTADFNHDGKPDLAVITGAPTSGLSILLGNGNGTLQLPLTYSAPSGVTSIATGDFNGDGNLDIVITNSAVVSVYYGNGDGTFQSSVNTSYPLPYLAVGDFNGDGRTDLVGLLGALPATIAITAPPSTVSFGQLVTLTATVSPSNVSGTVTFYDGATPLGTVPVVSGMASLTTTIPGSDLQQISAVFHATGAYDDPSSPIIPVTVTVGAGGIFESAVNYPVGSKPSAIATGDFNGDGRPDLAVANAGSNTITVLFGQADGTLGNAQTLSVGVQPVTLAAGDFNGDGVSDLVVGNTGAPASLTVFLSVNGTLAPSPTVTLTSAPASILAADINRDGKLDLIVSSVFPAPSLLLLGNGDGTFSADPNTIETWGAIAAGDFNGDGYPDFLIGSELFFGDGTSQFRESGSLEISGSIVVAGDFNGDGKLDLASVEYSQQIGISLGNGDGTFQAERLVALPSTPVALATGDFNGDGKLDLAIIGSDGKAGVMFGNGDGTLQFEVEYAAGAQPSALVVGDFNHDGILDLAVANAGSNTVSILSGMASTCTYTPSLSSTAFDLDGGTVTLTVTTNLPGCPWSATEVVSYDSGFGPRIFSGTGTGTAQFTVPENTTGVDSTATIVIGAQQLVITVDTTVTQFQDVPPGAFAFDAINLLKQNNITDGCTATDFCPTENVTRAQMAVFIIRSIFGGDNFPYPSAQIFNDVPPSSFGYQWIQELSALGITSGCGGGSFCPDDPITREQMAVFIIRARYGATTNFPYSPTPYFTDVPIGAFGFDYIQRMDQDGITTGCTATTFCPLSDVSRAEMAVFIMRGMFNELMPTGFPFVTGQPLGCEVVSGGTATCQIFAANATFDDTTQLSAAGGLTFSSVQVLDPTNLVFTVTAPAGVTQVTPESVFVSTGTQLLVSPNLIAIEPAQ